MTSETNDPKAQLDQMLADGKISQEEYESLAQALEQPRKARTSSSNASSANPTGGFRWEGKRPLRRIPQKGMIAGVCAGLAETGGWDVTTVRIIAALCLVFGLPITLTVYLIMAIVLPVEPAGPASTEGGMRSPESRITLGEEKAKPIPVFFAISLFGLWLFSFMYGHFILPRIFEVYAQMGSDLPAITLYAFKLGGFLGISGHSLIKIILHVMALFTVVAAYMIIPDRILRFAYAWIVVGVYLLITLCFILFTSLPYYAWAEKIR
ncbi:MAG: PspC domain-containing protein [Candidatus Sumerlaeia bacterium]